MVGEIRDTQTASISIQASLTGHLVLSTLHTNNATAAITRLIDMDIEKFLLSSSILGVLAQRLVRILCDTCKVEDTSILHKDHMNIPSGTTLYKSSSCTKCDYTGYSGRRAMGELFVIDDVIQDVIKNDISDHELRSLATKRGMKTLQDKILNMFINGETSWEEIIRIGLQS
jgi:general secretion pathway protein E